MGSPYHRKDVPRFKLSSMDRLRLFVNSQFAPLSENPVALLHGSMSGQTICAAEKRLRAALKRRSTPRSRYPSPEHYAAPSTASRDGAATAARAA